MRLRPLCLTAALAVSLTLSLHAQQSTISKVAFRNPGPYREADLETVAGVHAGQKLTLGEMQAAAQRLVDTGCFDTVKLDSKGTPAALTLLFVLQPSGTGAVHKIGFANFVWFTPDEVMGIARQVAPLAPSGLPEGGGVLDSISDALQTALAAKGIPGAQVGHTLILPSSAVPLSAIEYRVNKPFVELNTVALEDVTPRFATAVQGIAAKLRGKTYVGGPTQATDGALLRPYFDAGYLDAHFVDEHTSFTQQQPGVVGVNLAAKVSSGEPYHVAAIRFDGSPVVSAAVFDSGAKLHAGDIASQAQLLDSIEPVDAAYHKLGYMDEYVDSGAKLDNANHTVSYELSVIPGEIYRLHSVTVQGLSPEARAEFNQGWTMKVGAPYDAAYVAAFLNKNTALRSLNRYAGSFAAAADPSTHLVDLTVSFVSSPGK